MANGNVDTVEAHTRVFNVHASMIREMAVDDRNQRIYVWHLWRLVDRSNEFPKSTFNLGERWERDVRTSR